MPKPTTEPSRSIEFTTFMRAYQHMVFSTAARLAGNDMQGEDIAQEVFIKAYENFDRLRDSPTAGGWLKTVATNLSLNYLSRYRKRWRFFSEDETAIEVPMPDTLAADLGADQQHARIEEALRRLPERQRIPLILFHFEDMSYEQIASKLGASIAKIKTDIHRARAALVPVLERSGINAGTLQEDL